MAGATQIQTEWLLPACRCWTRSEYERVVELGLFGPDERLELIEGDIVEKITQNSPHVTAINLTVEALRPLLTGGFHQRVQAPLAVSDRSQPEPDIAVVAGTIREYVAQHPTTAALVVEIPDSSLAYDRAIKASLYAQAGVGEYWILNLNDRLLEVHRQLVLAAGQQNSSAYASVIQYSAGETVAPLFASSQIVGVADLLP